MERSYIANKSVLRLGVMLLKKEKLKMEWREAQKLIEKKIKIGTDLNTDKSTYRFVKSIGGSFIVPIGKSNKINISWKMLEKCFLPITLSKEYDGRYFRKCFDSQAKNKWCYVHVVGQIFVKAGIAKQKDKHTYIGI